MAKKDKVQSNDGAAVGTVVKWGEGESAVSFDLSTAPEATVLALAQRGFTHVMGNEVASALASMKKETNEDGTVKYSDAEIASAASAKREAKLAEMAAGTLGVRVGGARPTGIDKMVRDIAISELRAIAVAKKASLPKKAEELNPLIEKHLAKHGDRIRAKAQAQADELAALAGDLANE